MIEAAKDVTSANPSIYLTNNSLKKLFSTNYAFFVDETISYSQFVLSLFRTSALRFRLKSTLLIYSFEYFFQIILSIVVALSSYIYEA